MGVVHDLAAHVDGRAELVEHPLDGLDGAVDAGAVAARRDELELRGHDARVTDPAAYRARVRSPATSGGRLRPGRPAGARAQRVQGGLGAPAAGAGGRRAAGGRGRPARVRRDAAPAAHHPAGDWRAAIAPLVAELAPVGAGRALAGRRRSPCSRPPPAPSGSAGLALLAPWVLARPRRIPPRRISDVLQLPLVGRPLARLAIAWARRSPERRRAAVPDDGRRPGVADGRPGHGGAAAGGERPPRPRRPPRHGRLGRERPGARRAARSPARIARPALVVAGTLDRVTPPSGARWLADALPDGRLLSLPGVGHFPHLEAPERGRPRRSSPISRSAMSAELLDLATRAARAAGDLLLERAGGPVSGVVVEDLQHRPRQRHRPRRRGADRRDDRGPSGPATRSWARRAPTRRRLGRGALARRPARRDHQLPLGHPPVERQRRGARRRRPAGRRGARPVAGRDLRGAPRRRGPRRRARRCGSGPGPPLDEALVGTGFNYVSALARAARRRPCRPSCRPCGTCAASARRRSTSPGWRAAASTATSSAGSTPGTGRRDGSSSARPAALVDELPATAEDPVGCIAAPPALFGPLRALLDDAGA